MQRPLPHEQTGSTPGDQVNRRLICMTHIPLTRHDALTAWADFLPTLGHYAHRRNHVEPLHRNVSRLSAALRYRLLLEEVLEGLAGDAAGRVEELATAGAGAE